MKVWEESALLAIYTLASTHFGTGHATGAVDLPIARDASTGLPVLPATGLKGVARDYLTEALSTDTVDSLFGKSLDDSEVGGALQAGRLAFTEGRLLLYPVRSLNRPFLYVTCRLILERLDRDLRALGHADFLPATWSDGLPGEESGDLAGAVVADRDLDNQALVLEDLVYRKEEVVWHESLGALAAKLGELLPEVERPTRHRLTRGLVVVPDDHFTELIRRAVPVRARIKLTGGKTTDKWTNPETGKEESGNLWYEEHLPSDCLFLAFVGERRQRTFAQGGPPTPKKGLADFARQAHHLQVLQIGGNETVGHGLCYCTLWPRPTAPGASS